MHFFKTLEQPIFRSKMFIPIALSSYYWWSLTYALNWWIQVAPLHISSVLDSNLQGDIEVMDWRFMLQQIAIRDVYRIQSSIK